MRSNLKNLAKGFGKCHILPFPELNQLAAEAKSNTAKYDELFKAVYGYIIKFCRDFHRRQGFHAELDDMVQEAFTVVLYKVIEKYDISRGNFIAFLHTALSRHLSDWVWTSGIIRTPNWTKPTVGNSRNVEAVRLLHQVDNDFLSRTYEEADYVIDQMARAELLQIMQECMLQLPEVKRHCLKESFSGRPHKELGAIHGKSKSWGSLIVQKGIEHLRILFRERVTFTVGDTI